MLGVSAYAVAALLAASVAWSVLDLLRKVLVAKVRPLALLFWLTAGSVPFFVGVALIAVMGALIPEH